MGRIGKTSNLARPAVQNAVNKITPSPNKKLIHKGPFKRTQHCWAQYVASVCMEPQQCWQLLPLVGYSLKPIKLRRKKSQDFYCSVTGEAAICMKPQQCWPRENVCARVLQVLLYQNASLLWTTANNVGSCCVRLHAPRDKCQLLPTLLC